MPRQLSSEEVSAYGLSCPSHQMDNDELRFRLMGSDGSGYIRTVAGDTGGVAEQPLPPRRHRVVRVCREAASPSPSSSRTATSRSRSSTPAVRSRANPGVPPQRVHVRRAAETHTVKFGRTDLSLHPHCRNGDKGDWWPAPDLDAVATTVPHRG
jgi:hypothetical protein